MDSIHSDLYSNIEPGTLKRLGVVSVFPSQIMAKFDPTLFSVRLLASQSTHLINGKWKTKIVLALCVPYASVLCPLPLPCHVKRNSSLDFLCF